MAQHDYIISNQSGAAFRSDLNNALSAIVSQNSGASEPSTTYAYQFWADSTTGLLKQRNAANSAWITLGTLGSANLGLLPLSGGTMTGALLGAAGSTSAPGFSFSGDSNTGFWAPAADTIAASTGGTERARIDSSGRVLVGTSSARTNFRLNGTSYVSQVQSEGSEVIGLSAVRAGGAYSVLANSTTATNGATAGVLTFSASDGTNFIQAAEISAVIDATPGTNDMPGRLIFSTTGDGASSPSERLRITQAGIINLNGQRGGFSTPMSGSGNVRVAAASGGGIAINTFDIQDYTAVQFVREVSGTAQQVGTITCSSSATAYNTSSDYRLKENVVPLTGAIDRINELQVHRFNFIVDPDRTVDGFIAHEAQAVVPECVTGIKDEIDDDGNPIYQGIDQSKLVPLLTAALQEAITKIETLETKVAALEGN